MNLISDIRAGQPIAGGKETAASTLVRSNALARFGNPYHFGGFFKRIGNGGNVMTCILAVLPAGAVGPAVSRDVPTPMSSGED
jgi:hypothetical protein